MYNTWKIQDENLVYSCGCKFKVIKDRPGSFPLIEHGDPYTDWNFDCEAMKMALADGNTLGIFQLEGGAGHRWTKELKPENIFHLAALTAIIRPGCISGDAKICVHIYDSAKKKLNCQKITLKKLYEKWNRNHPSFGADIVSLNEDNNIIIPNKITNVTYSGKKSVYRPILRERTRKDYNDCTLECTLDHKLLVLNKGWTELKDINIGDRVAILNRRPRVTKEKINIKGEKNFRNICFYHYEYKCIFCDWKDGSLDVNHIDGNRKTNNDYSNLSFMCPNHHRMYSENKISKNEAIDARKKYEIKISDNILWSQFDGKEYVGEKDTYDISVKGPNHNFIADDVVVHNCAESIAEDGISITKRYCMYKNGEQVAVPEMPALGILKDNYYQMIYQEDALMIAREIAGFTPVEANALRKGIGKKLPEIIAGLKVTFLEGCKKVGKVSEQEAIRLFDSIEKSQRYSFPKSHAFEYAVLSQVTAYAKVHFSDHFYTSYLEGADNKQDPLENRYKLIQDAKFFDIKVTKPDLRYSKPWFYSPKLKSILFGLNSVKSVGDSTIKQVKDFCTKESNQWLDILVNCLYRINIRAAQNIIKAGIIENGMTRKRQLHELNVLCELTAKGQIEWIFKNVYRFDTLKDLLRDMNKPKKEGGGLHSIKDVPKIDGLIFTLDNPGYSLEDNPEWIAASEEEILGIALSASLLDSVSSNIANTTCKDIACGKATNNMLVKCQIDRVNELEIKNGKNKGKKFFRVDLSDETGIVSGAMVWPETHDKYGHLAKERNTVCIKLYRNNRGDIVVNDIFQI